MRRQPILSLVLVMAVVLLLWMGCSKDEKKTTRVTF